MQYRILIPMLFLVPILIGSKCTPIREACNSVPIQDHLFEIDYNNRHWNSELKNGLADPTFKLHRCLQHFGAGSPSGAEVEAGVEEINRLVGTEVHIQLEEAGHRTKLELYQRPVTGNYFDYVDNLTETMAIPCRNGNDIPCGDILYDGTNEISADGYHLTVCKFNKILPTDPIGYWGGLGRTHNFIVAVNGVCYNESGSSIPAHVLRDIDNVPLPYPERGNVMHELGHAFGMIHTDSSDQHISIMQGQLDHLSAYDAAYLRRHYPKNAPGYTNLAVSSLVRPFLNGGYRKRLTDPNRNIHGEHPSTMNPRRLSSNGIVSNPDDNSSQSPKFYIAWFNNGTEPIESPECILNAIVLESLDGRVSLPLHIWKMSHIPAQSQDQFMERCTVDPEKYDQLDKSKDYQITFYIDYANGVKERYEDDNQFSYPIELE